MDFFFIKEISGIILLSVDWFIINIERNLFFFFILKKKLDLVIVMSILKYFNGI